MPVAKKPCKHHPDQLTSRRCYQCKQYICKDCQNTLDGHIFCGYVCYLKWKWAHFSKRISVSTEFRIIIVLILLTNLLNWVLINKCSDRFTHPERSSAGTTGTVRYDTLFFDLDTTRQWAGNEVKISMRMAPGLLIGLKKNGTFVDSRVSGSEKTVFDLQVLEQGKNLFSIWVLNREGQSILADSFSITFSSSRLNYLSKSVDQIPSAGKALSLTFDGGSLRNGSEEILNTLDSLGLRGSMFLTGKYISSNPDLVRKMMDSGHEIGNHTYSHPHLTNLEIDGTNHTREGIDRRELYRQLDHADSLLFKTTKRHMAPFWRAPYGEINDRILLWAAERGYKHIGWSPKCDTWDWVADTGSALYRTNRQIAEHLLNLETKNGLNGKIILMHLGTERHSDFPYTVLPELVTTLRSRGYVFKPIGELLKEGRHRTTVFASP